jgi:hypothetical protein
MRERIVGEGGDQQEVRKIAEESKGEMHRTERKRDNDRKTRKRGRERERER